MSNFLIYGANGYTGSLIAREALRRGHRPIVAGRDERAIPALAEQLGLEHRVFGLDRPADVQAALQGNSVVLNCAGPFARTAIPLVDACLRSATHYLDITGEIDVFESLVRRDDAAKAAGVMLLPGAGFDVVPSDCLAAHLKRRLPSATRLLLAFMAGSGISRGTAQTVLEGLPKGGRIRRNGQLTRVPLAWKTRSIVIHDTPVTTVTVAWGDVSTAYFSTHIGDIEVYAAAGLSQRLGLRFVRYLGPVLGLSAVQRWLGSRIRGRRPGPSDEERALARSYLWGEVSDAHGQRRVSRLQGPSGYTLTIHAALAIAERVLAGQTRPGYQTPSTAYGPDLVLEIEGVIRTDDTQALGARG